MDLDWSLKMKTIQSKINATYLPLIIIVPILILILFNIAFRFIIIENTRQDHDNAMDMIQLLIREQISQLNFRDNPTASDNLRAFLEGLNRSVRITKRTQNTEILLINPLGNLIYPQSASDSILPEDFIKEILADVQRNKDMDSSEKNFDGDAYIISYKSLKSNPLRPDQNVLVFISPLDAMEGIVGQLNLLLIGIVVATILLGFLISIKVSKEISKPIAKASDYARSIAKGQWSDIHEFGRSKEIQSLYDSLNHMSKKLKEKNDHQNRYFENISHDLRTPLMSIQGYAEGIEKNIFKDQVEAAQIIKNESMRLKSFVDQVLTLSKFENHYEISNPEIISIKEELDSIMVRYRGLTKDKNMEIILDCPDELEIFLDLKVFETIISNILSNAIHYGQERVTIHVYEDQAYIHVEIHDDGPGIEKDLTEKIFQRFEKGASGNFGLGLAIVSSAMSAIDGKVSLVPKELGACFKLSFKKNNPDL